MLCFKICFSEPEPVEVEILWVEPEARSHIFFPEPKKRSGGGAEEKWLRNTGKRLLKLVPGTYLCDIMLIDPISE